MRLQQGSHAADGAQPVDQRIPPGDVDRAGIRTDQSQQHLERGGLARPVSAHEAIDAAPGNREGYAIHGQGWAEAATQVAGFNSKHVDVSWFNSYIKLQTSEI